MMFCLAPGAALAEDALAAGLVTAENVTAEKKVVAGTATAGTVVQVAVAEDETAAPVPFQIPAASFSAGAELEPSELPSLALLLLLLSGGLVAGTLSSLFHSLSQRDAAAHHPAPSQRW